MVKLEHISIAYQNNLILEDVNLEIKQGEIVCIIGPSGSGKSSLIRVINPKDPDGEFEFPCQMRQR